ncbi:MAG: ribosomal L7Ae/L30e/S12e/Gadd45 family protein [Nitrosopumilaceae archaeon]|nr:ribosomal L7Ae/L30e/S12e/Gadd45 family protein [Nitrosopumilaceae archaeon]
MSKLLAKTLKDAVHEKRLVTGARQVMNAAGDPSLVVLSDSNNATLFHKASESVEKSKVPIMRYGGTSVALGKLCGLQFRVSALAIMGVDDSLVQSIMKENE